MQVDYDFEEWAATTTRGRRIFNYNIWMSEPDLSAQDLTLVKVVPMQENSSPNDTIFMWQTKATKDEELVRVSIAEFDDWRQAQQRLNSTLRDCMRPEIPPASGKLSSLGDVAFAGREPESDLLTAVFFARANACVTVTSVGETSIDISTVAIALDAFLLEGPSKKRTSQSSPPSSKNLTVKANDTKPVIEDLSKVAGRSTWLHVVASDGELVKRGNALFYFSGKSGKKTITTTNFLTTRPTAKPSSAHKSS